ncbi:MAG: 3-methyl-2-oxobutanoate dehydrogenase subunit VorB [Candidatus Delongbacteria bacterium]|nr:3-methyl-2-oxobutanoate dehydrogenase subunit VorB [Candidatus Delongbacteria bacterium]
MAKELIKGNEAIIKAALLAGCRSFFGYPITPASEIAQAAAWYFPQAGRTFLQAECETASINMLYGAASAGERTMTASSGPGISLMQEGISYCAGSELPCVIAYIMRGGPGLGNIAPEQSDYFQVVKGGGHGNYRMITLAPNSVQEMADLTFKLFDLTDRYRNPGYLLADGVIGQMMEPVEFPSMIQSIPAKEWALLANADTRKNLITSINLDPDEQEAHIRKLYQKYARIEENEPLWEEYRCDDAEIVLVGYGIISRILFSVVELARQQGIKAGLFRPISLWPFPRKPLMALTERTRKFLVVEMSTGMLVDDIRLFTEFRCPVEFYSRYGGNVPSIEEIMQKLSDIN